MRDEKISTDQHLLEKKLSSKSVYAGKLLKVFDDEVELPDGNTANREWIKHQGAAFVLLYLRQTDEIVFVRQFRYPVAKVLLELPAGKLDPGEDPVLCASRETEEETGYIPTNLEYVLTLNPCVGYSDEVIHFYYCEEFEIGKAALDHGEFLDCVKIGAENCRQMLLNGEIPDAKTAIGLGWFFMSNKRG
jgi:ADP-ribose pyrophosphatase